MKIIIALLLFFVFSQQEHKKILFIGDSMTCYQYGWHHQFSKKINTEYTNLSSVGKRTLWMKQTLESHLKITSSYKTCFIYGGINDGFSSVKIESAVQNIQDMVDLCNQYKIKPVVIIGYDPNTVMIKLRPSIKTQDLYRSRYDQIQKLLGKNLKNCQIIPLAETITREDTDDGIHFKASGHKKFSEWVYNCFN